MDNCKMLSCTILFLLLYYTCDTVGYMHGFVGIDKTHVHGSTFAISAGYKGGYVAMKRDARHRSKVLKVTMPRLNMHLDAKLAESDRILTRRQKVNFGYRLAQNLGDGGNIHCYNDFEDKETSVFNYFTAHLTSTRRPKFDKAVLKQVAENPNKTAGEFADKPSIFHKCFYTPKFKFFAENEYTRAAKGTSAIRALYHSLSKKQRGYRAYHGLQTEILFTRTPKDQLDILRLTEIDCKRNALSPKTPLFTHREKHANEKPTIHDIAQRAVQSAHQNEQD